jgi:hypothetical protein
MVSRAVPMCSNAGSEIDICFAIEPGCGSEVHDQKQLLDAIAPVLARFKNDIPTVFLRMRASFSSCRIADHPGV